MLQENTSILLSSCSSVSRNEEKRPQAYYCPIFYSSKNLRKLFGMMTRYRCMHVVAFQIDAFLHYITFFKHIAAAKVVISGPL